MYLMIFLYEYSYLKHMYLIFFAINLKYIKIPVKFIDGVIVYLNFLSNIQLTSNTTICIIRTNTKARIK